MKCLLPSVIEKLQNNQLKTPSDNCILELGIFVGSLEPRRCFVLSSVSSKDLVESLSDFRGVNYFKVSEEELNDGCRSQAMFIKDSIVKQGYRINYEPLPLITKEKLKELEKYQEENGNLISSGHIIVNAFQPLELADKNFSKRVINNIINIDISYTYFFQSTEGNIAIIAKLLQALAATHLDVSTSRDRLNTMSLSEENKQKTKNNLQCLQGKLKIYFLESETPIEYCIHNAEFRSYAKCYLRRPTIDGEIRFVEWSRGTSAHNIANSLLKLRKPDQDGSFIFGSTTDVDLISGKFKDIFLKPLKDECLKLFPSEIHDTVNSVCFPPNS